MFLKVYDKPKTIIFAFVDGGAFFFVIEKFQQNEFMVLPHIINVKKI